MTGPPIVSVIVPTRDYARYLPEAIASVQAQTLTSWECIVIDDGSVDSTPAVLDEIVRTDPRIKVLRQPRTGVSAARNLGLAAALGRHVQFLDADDRLGAVKLAEQVAVLEARPGVDVVYGRAEFVIRAGDQPVRELLDPAAGLAWRFPETSGDEMLELLLVHNRFVVEAPLVRRSILDKAGIFDERLDRMEDWDLWIRIALAGARFAFIESAQPTVYVGVHGASVSQGELEMLSAEVVVRERLEPMLRKRPAARRLNSCGLLSRRMALAVMRGLDGEVRRSTQELLVLAVRSRRPRWLIWALMLPMAHLGGGRRLLAWLWSRHRAAAGTA
ncbi:MAG: glycosyltransferase [Chloroflexota bacterium]